MPSLSSSIKLSNICPGNNPRTFFDESEMDELITSIRASGVMQPILVRPKDDGTFSIIAGERRWRASKVVFGEDGEIPVVIRECDDAEAEVLSLVENAIRANMSATEEAQAAHRELLRSKGDKAEAAARIGWPVVKLERRLALMRLTDEVRTALNKREIGLGHAELLAALSEEKQNTTLPKIIQHRVSVAQLKSQIGKLANTLESASFDKTQCGTCQFNSACQTALFAESIGNGYCTNPSCYEAKTEAHIECLAVQMREEVPRVEVVKPASALKVIKLVVEGRLGVGEVQAKACGSCANFGCTVSALPGSLGEIERDICFDEDCNTQKIQEHLKNEALTQAAAQEASKAVKSKGGTQEQANAAGVKAEQAKKAEIKAKITVIASQRVKDYRLTVSRQVAARVMNSQPELSACVLVALALTSKARLIDSSKIGQVLKREGGEHSSFTNVGASAKNIFEISVEGRNKLLTALAPSAMKQCDETDITGIFEFLGIDLGKHWKINEEFLKLLTKSEIEFIANEIGLVAAMTEKKFKAAMTEKRDDLIKTLLVVDCFSYDGVVPQCMNLSSKSSATVAVTHVEATDDEGEPDGDGDAEGDGSAEEANECAA